MRQKCLCQQLRDLHHYHIVIWSTSTYLVERDITDIKIYWNEMKPITARVKRKKPTCNWNVERMTKKTCFWNTYHSSTLRTTSNWSGGLFTWIKCQTFSVAMIERNSIFPVSASRLTNEPRFFHVNCPVAIDSSFFPWTSCLKLLHRFR